MNLIPRKWILKLTKGSADTIRKCIIRLNNMNELEDLINEINPELHMNITRTNKLINILMEFFVRI